jgi:hypothetical protein|tara:strand:+ start:634 stop:1053 length:420 start_codon:yes stop_codon:yes gene_type:complete
MATTTATITLSSADIMDNNISISNTATLTDAGNDTGVTKTTGLTRVTTSSASNVVLLDSAATGGTEAQSVVTSGKVFIQNLNTRVDGSKFVTVKMDAVVIGRLYGGDWMFFPWQGGAGNDVEIQPSSTTDTTLEYVAFY